MTDQTGYFDDHPDDSEQEADLKQTVRDWLHAFAHGRGTQ